MTPIEFRGDLWHQKTRVFGVSCGVVFVILRLAVLVEHRLVTDGQTDRHRAMASIADAYHRVVKIQIGFTFLVQAHPGSPGQRAAKRARACVLGSGETRVRCGGIGRMDLYCKCTLLFGSKRTVKIGYGQTQLSLSVRCLPLLGHGVEQQRPFNGL